MTWFLTYLVEVSICMIAFYLLYRYAFSKSKHFEYNRIFLLASVILPFIIPAISLDLPAGTFVNQYQVLLESVSVSQQMAGETSTSFSYYSLLYSFYIIGSIFLLIKLAIQLFAIFRYVRAGYKESIAGEEVIRVKGSFDTGSFLHYILWNETNRVSEAEQRVIIQHEKVHVRQGHSFDILLSEIAIAVLWFNPVSYLIRNAIRENHEFIADQIVCGENTTGYINLMAKQALAQNGLVLTSSFNSAQIIKRINMMKASTNRSTVTRYLLVAPLLLGLIAVFSCETGTMGIQDEMDNEAVVESVKTVEGPVLTEVDEVPVPKGGFPAFFSYIGENLKYPEEAKENGVEGKVFVEFVVTRDGEIRDVTIKQGIGSGCDEAALAIVENSENWTPGVHEGQNVNVKLVLPITFKMEE